MGRSEAAVLDRQQMAALRQCRRQFARRKPAIERWGTRPRLFELDHDLDRLLLAALCLTHCERLASVAAAIYQAHRDPLGRWAFFPERSPPRETGQ